MNDYIISELEKIAVGDTTYGHIAKYLLETDDMSKVSINEIVKECYVSVSTPTRLAKHLGYDGFKELKYELNMAKKYRKRINSEEIDVTNYVQRLNDSLSRSLSFIDNDMLLEIAKLIHSSEKIKLFAVADTGLVALDFTYKLERLNKAVDCYTDYHLQQVYAKLATNKDTAIGISYSGKTEEVLENLKICKEKGAKTFLLTSRDISCDYIDYVINISSSEEMSRKYSMISRITILSVLDIIYLKFVQINKEDSDLKFGITKIRK